MIGIIVAKKIAEKYNTLEKLVEIFEEANIELREKYVRGELIIRDDFMVKAKQLDVYWGCDPACVFLEKYTSIIISPTIDNIVEIPKKNGEGNSVITIGKKIKDD